MERGQGFNTPNLEGKAYKNEGRWRTTTPIPSIKNIQIVSPPEFLKDGMHIQYDLLTFIKDGGNDHIAVDVERFEKRKEQKLKPKQRDKVKKRKI
jgi:hypothetical protein